MSEFTDSRPAGAAEERGRANGDHHPEAAAVDLGAGEAPGAFAARDSWGPEIPALRLTQVGAAREPPEGAPAAIPPDYDSPAPRLLRAIRALAGLALLLLAWGATTAALALGGSLPAGPPHGPGLSLGVVLGLALYVLTALGAAWLAVVALACVVAGAFALSLALGARGW